MRTIIFAALSIAAFAAHSLSTPAMAQAFVCPAAAPPGKTCDNPEFLSCGINVDATRRHFCIHKPALPLGQLPVVWGFHGRTGEGAVMMRNLADQTEQGMVLIAPSALESGSECVPAWRHLGRDRATWSEIDTGTDACVAPAAAAAFHTTNNDADLHFVEALLDEIESQVEGVTHYALGFSNGGGMVYQLMITRPLSDRFEAFAALGMSASAEKIEQSTVAAAGDWTAETEARHPFFGQQGTADRVFVPVAQMMRRTEQLKTRAEQAALAVAGGATDPRLVALANSSCNMGANVTVAAVFECWREFPMGDNLKGNTYIDAGLVTRRWLNQRNRTQPRAFESVYPDLGHGADTGLRREDATVTVRREWPARRNGVSEPVVWLNSIDAAHNLAGSRGAYPPCGNNHCDIDIIREVLQFWRANAGLRSLWR